MVKNWTVYFTREQFRAPRYFAFQQTKKLSANT